MKYKDIFSLRGKTAIVTGGAGYIGAAIAQGFLDFGASVVIADVVSDGLSGKLAEYPRENYLFVECDLCNPQSIKEMYETTKSKFGGIDVLVACAAYTGYGGTGTVISMTDETWEAGIEGTIGITFKCIREAIPYMEDNGGSIITFGSLYAWIAPDFGIYDSGNVSPPNYGAGKAAIIQLTRHCASQFSSRNIRVNSITPGSYPHPASFENKQFMEKLSKRTMMGRIGYPEDLVGASILLASDASGYMTGTNITIDGGQLAW